MWITAEDVPENGSRLSSVEYRLDGGEWQTYRNPVSVDEAGDHTVEYRATDRAGNVSEVETVTFTIANPDTTAPEVEGQARPGPAKRQRPLVHPAG